MISLMSLLYIFVKDITINTLVLSFWVFVYHLKSRDTCLIIGEHIGKCKKLMNEISTTYEE